jgi:hypothetical protein
MTEGVTEQETAEPVKEVVSQHLNDKDNNFRRLEQAREADRERAIKAETELAFYKQQSEMQNQRNRPQEVDPLDSMEDYVDPKVLKTALEQRERRFKREAEEITDKKLREWKQQELQENHMDRLKSQYNDYDQVMNEKNIVDLEQANPEFVQSLLSVKDDYERKKLAYNFLKRNTRPKESLTASIKEKVEANAKNPYYIAAGSGTPSAMDYDIKSPQARAAAYQKLKDAQRRPIGDGRLN